MIQLYKGSLIEKLPSIEDDILTVVRQTLSEKVVHEFYVNKF